MLSRLPLTPPAVCETAARIRRARRGPRALAGAAARWAAAAGLGLCALVIAAPVHAAPGGATIDRSGDLPESDGAPTMVGDASMGIAAEARPDENVAAISPEFELGMRPRPEVELRIGFGAVATFREDATGRSYEARPSNLEFGASRVFDQRDDRWRYAKVGFSFVIPTAFANTEGEHEAYEYAMASRTGWDPWSWTPSTLGVIVPAEVRLQVSKRWVIGSDGALGVLLPGTGVTDNVAIAAQVAGEARLVTRLLGMGVRLAAAWNGRHPTDRGQAGVSPFVDASLCRRSAKRRITGLRARTSDQCPVFASARLNLNLDGPYGFTGRDALGVWGVQVGLGWAVY